MHHHIDTILKRLRQDAARYLDREFVEQACREIGHRWRNRVLTPVDVLHWFLLQIALGNTAVEHVALLANRVFSGSAYCQARARLPLAFFQTGGGKGGHSGGGKGGHSANLGRRKRGT